MPQSVQNVRRHVKTKRTSKRTKRSPMDKKSERAAQRLTELRLSKGYLTATDLAVGMGMEKRTVQAHEKGRGIMKNLPRYADFFGKTLDYFVSESTQDIAQTDEDTPLILALRPIPIIDLTSLTQALSVKDMLKIKTKLATGVPKLDKIGPKSRGFRVLDDSMVDLAKKYDYSIHPNTCIIFDPDAQPVAGKAVVAKLQNPPRIVVRLYGLHVLPGSSKSVPKLIPHNPFYPEEIITEEADGFIYGRVVRVILEP